MNHGYCLYRQLCWFMWAKMDGNVEGKWVIISTRYWQQISLNVPLYYIYKITIPNYNTSAYSLIHKWYAPKYITSSVNVYLKYHLLSVYGGLYCIHILLSLYNVHNTQYALHRRKHIYRTPWENYFHHKALFLYKRNLYLSSNLLLTHLICRMLYGDWCITDYRSYAGGASSHVDFLYLWIDPIMTGEAYIYRIYKWNLKAVWTHTRV